MHEQGQLILKREQSAPHVYEALHALKRTGWVKRGVANPESVKEHTESLLLLAHELAPRLSEQELQGLMEMLEVHDWPEALHGDEVILEESPGDKKALLDAKFENEKRALEKICTNLADGEEVRRLWLRFETSDDPAATFGRQLDKYQAVEKALEYEKAQGIPLFEEFLTYSIKYITHKVLIERLEKLKERWAN